MARCAYAQCCFSKARRDCSEVFPTQSWVQVFNYYCGCDLRYSLMFPLYHLQNSLTFELFSVMVHSGSAAGGHYYACIKSFTDGQWYSFNDQHVSKVSITKRSSSTNTIEWWDLTILKAQLWKANRVCVSVCVDLPRRHQEDIRRVDRKQRLLFQCLRQVSRRAYLCWLMWFTGFSNFLTFNYSSQWFETTGLNPLGFHVAYIA